MGSWENSGFGYFDLWCWSVWCDIGWTVVVVVVM